MKILIKWLAEISGVAKQIRKEAYKKSGHEMQKYAFWFSDGKNIDVSNILFEYPNWCLNYGEPHMYGSDYEKLRDLIKDKSRNEVLLIEETSIDLGDAKYNKPWG